MAKKLNAPEVLKSVSLTKGKCAVCGGPIEVDWAGPNPSLGTQCRKCGFEDHDIFGVDNIHFKFKRELHYNPFFGDEKYDFNWRGTQVKINDEIGTIGSTQGDASYVSFPSDTTNTWGVFVKGLGYFDLLKIYEAQGGAVKPRKLNLKPHFVTKEALLEQPLLTTHIKMEEGIITFVSVGNPHDYEALRPQNIPYMEMLHAFCNMYVRYKFGLAPNFCAEGGFYGKNFEVRNCWPSTVGLSVRMNQYEESLKHVTNEEEFMHLSTLYGVKDLLYKQENSRPGVVIHDALASQVIPTWVHMMSTLLRYDWTKQPSRNRKDIWNAFCKMQDVAANILSEEELTGTLQYAITGKMVHAGSSF